MDCQEACRGLLQPRVVVGFRGAIRVPLPPLRPPFTSQVQAESIRPPQEPLQPPPPLRVWLRDHSLSLSGRGRPKLLRPRPDLDRGRGQLLDQGRPPPQSSHLSNYLWFRRPSHRPSLPNPPQFPAQWALPSRRGGWPQPQPQWPLRRPRLLQGNSEPYRLAPLPLPSTVQSQPARRVCR